VTDFLIVVSFVLVFLARDSMYA